jgi:hypothetical protein
MPGTFDISINVPGSTKLSFMVGTRLCPPDIKDPLSPASASIENASSIELATL